MDAILKRRSVRKFDLSKRVDDETLKRLCYYAEQAPTARNQKSRSYVIINDEAIIKELSTVSEGARVLEGANSCICVVGNDPKGLSTPLMQSADLAAAVENILIEATALNLGSVWMGMYPMEERMSRAHEILNLPKDEFVYALIAIGYPLDKAALYERRKEAIISFNRR